MKPLPSIPAPFTMPFYYANLWTCAVYYLVDIERVQPYLAKTGLEPATLTGRALVSFDFQSYAGQFSANPGSDPQTWPAQSQGLTQELELNVLAFPAGRSNEIPELTPEDFLLGEDQTKLLGNWRLHVACDDDVAIAAGIKLFGEPKFKTSFRVNLPSLNPVRRPGSEYGREWQKQWGFGVNDPDQPDESIFRCQFDADGMVGLPGSVSPTTEYGVHDDSLIGCRWEFAGPCTTYLLDADGAARVRVTFGPSAHPMGSDLKNLIGGVDAVAVQTFGSQPAAIQGRAYFP